MSIPADTVRDVARRWWRRHIDSTGDRRTDRRTGALLRRARTPQEAMTIPAAIELARRLGVIEGGAEHDDVEHALNLARVLAHVRSDEREHPMRKLGYPTFPTPDGNGDPPKLSELRFRRLLQTDSTGGVAAFTRLIAQLGEETNVADIAEAFWFWHRPLARVKQRWAFKYFNAEGAIPPSLTDDDPLFTEEIGAQ